MRFGAYGAGMLLDSAGMAGFYSYRDPNAARTLGCYRQTAEVLRGLGDMDMTAFVLGAVTENGSVCVLGSQRQIDACAGELDTVEAL